MYTSNINMYILELHVKYRAHCNNVVALKCVKARI